jgi:hypothetical protein
MKVISTETNFDVITMMIFKTVVFWIETSSCGFSIAKPMFQKG